MHKRIILFLLTALLAVVLGFVSFNSAQAVRIVHHAGYWVILVAFVAWGVALTRSLHADVREAWRTGLFLRWPVLLIVMASVLLQIHEEHGFKIVADEVLLNSTAMQMHFEREAAVVVRGYEYAGNYTPLNVFLDKRPLVFPFLLSAVHDFSGYRPGNVFALNAALGLCLLALVFLIGRRLAGEHAGAAGVLLLCGVPLVAQNAVGGGFELLNLVFLALTIWLALRAAERPDPDRVSGFILSGVLLAQVRYESALFVLPVGLVLVYLWVRKREVFLPWGVLIAPVLLVLVPLQQNVFKLSEASWQLQDVQGATSPFGLRYIYDNVGHAMNFFLSFDGAQPSSWMLAVLGVLCLGFLVLSFYREHREIFGARPVEAVAVLWALGLGLHALLMLGYFWGKWDDPIIRRLSLPTHLLFLLAIFLVWPRLVRVRHTWPALAAAAALFIVAFTVPAMAKHRYSQENLAARTVNWLDEHAARLEGRRVLAIDSNGGLMWMLHRHSGITVELLANRVDAFLFHYRNRSFDDVLLVQRMVVDLANNTRAPSAPDDFGDALQLELVDEKAFAPTYVLRLSRVVGVDGEKLKGWAAERKKFREAVIPAAAITIINRDEMVNWVDQLP